MKKENKSVEKMAIEKYGKELQTVVAIEEMSELIKELTKYLRGKASRNAIAEEVADVYIMLEQVMLMHDIRLSEVTNIMSAKLERLRKRMQES